MPGLKERCSRCGAKCANCIGVQKRMVEYGGSVYFAAPIPEQKETCLVNILVEYGDSIDEAIRLVSNTEKWELVKTRG